MKNHETLAAIEQAIPNTVGNGILKNILQEMVTITQQREELLEELRSHDQDHPPERSS